jgi:hypothetical protein
MEYRFRGDILMEFILHNTDIFDEDIGAKFNKVVKTNKDSFTKGNVYELTVSFHVNLLNDTRFDELNIQVKSKTNKGTRQDKVSDVMSYQLNKLEQILNENGIEVYSTTIQGDYLEEESIIKVEILEDKSKPDFIGRGKNKRRTKVSSIIPSMPNTIERMTKLASEIISKKFYELINIIRDRKLLSEILEIEETEDEDILFEAFAKQFGELWLTTNEREKELLNRLRDRCVFVLSKYIDKENEA